MGCPPLLGQGKTWLLLLERSSDEEGWGEAEPQPSGDHTLMDPNVVGNRSFLILKALFKKTKLSSGALKGLRQVKGCEVSALFVS